MVSSLIAFCVMVTHKTRGWSGDFFFYRYKEYRYLVAVNVIAFTYATFQVTYLTYRLVYEKHIITYRSLQGFNTHLKITFLNQPFITDIGLSLDLVIIFSNEGNR